MSYIGPRPFKCSECGKSFRRNSDLSRHALIHNPDAEKFRCAFPDCAYGALQKSNVVTHYISKHTRLRPHCCRFCRRRFADGSSLIRHEKLVHGFYRRSNNAYKNHGDCSGARLLNIPPSSTVSVEAKHEVNLYSVSFLPSLVGSSDVMKSSTSSISPVTPITSSIPIPDPGLTPYEYDWCPFVPQLLSGFFNEQDPQPHRDAGFLDEGSSLWPDATPQSYFSELWSSACPSDIPEWHPPDVM